MLDHIYGKPSTTLKRIESILFALALTKFIRFYYGQPHLPGNSLMRWFNKAFEKYTPWQILLGTVFSTYLLNKLSLFSPLHAHEPYARYYNRSFYRATWIMIAMDAGFWSARKIRPRFLRDIMSIILSIFYLISANAADYKVRSLRSAPTVELLRMSWEKQAHPLLKFISNLQLPQITWCGKKLLLPRHPSSYGYNPDDPKTKFIHVSLYYAGTPKLYPRVNQIILHFPGGGFICMTPQHHEDYLCKWAELSPETVVVALDYGKAPEYPYPFALEECFDLFKQIRASNGACLGLEGWYRSITTLLYRNGVEEARTEQVPLKPIKIVVSGDSAGGTLATGVVIKAIEKRVLVPDGLILVYPFLNIDLACWLPQQHSRLLRVESAKHVNAHLSLQDTTPSSPHALSKYLFPHKSPLPSPSSPASTSLASPTSRSVTPTPNQAHISSTHFATVTPSSSSSSSSSSTAATKTALTGPPSTRDPDANDPSSIGFFKKIACQLAKWREPPKTVFEVFGHASNAKTLAMTSRVSFFNDRILPPEILRALALLYLGPSTVPVNLDTDYLLSPILTPNPILQQFPKVYLICGEKDPLVDDVVIFSGRLREAKPNMDDTQVSQVVILEGLSHAFMNMLPFLREGKEATALIHAWFMEIFRESEQSASYFSTTGNLSRSSSTHSVVPRETVDVTSLLNRRTLHMSEGLFDDQKKESDKRKKSTPKEG